MKNFFAFTWKVFKQGYQWENPPDRRDSAQGESILLTDGRPIPQGGLKLEYDVEMRRATEEGKPPIHEVVRERIVQARDGTWTEGLDAQYQPLMDCSGLFLLFAWLPHTQTAILEFANQYGMLGEWQAITLSNYNPPKDFLEE